MKLSTAAVVGVALIVGAWGRPNQEPVKYDEVDMSLYDIVEGDMLVPKGSGSPYKLGYNAKSGRLWANGIVPYVISDKMNAHQKHHVHLGQQLIQNHTCVRFKPRTTEASYVEYINGHGCSSLTGRWSGKQPISLGIGCQELWVSAHEMMHALGILHEQSRYDRDNFVTINWNNIMKGCSHEFMNTNSSDMTVPRAFDFKSIMLYEPYACSANGRPTMESKVSGQRVLTAREKPDISDGDIFLINHLYNCKVAVSVTTTSPAKN
ncbi:Zinc metalloproteinase nas-7 [Halotydeus destructor]|nr:Zinc metalloproteinase nas-7 [Halotydeus destructor]